MLLLARQEGGARERRDEKGAKFITDICDANGHLQIDQSFGVSHETRMCFIKCRERFRQPFANGRSYN